MSSPQIQVVNGIQAFMPKQADTTGFYHDFHNFEVKPGCSIAAGVWHMGNLQDPGPPFSAARSEYKYVIHGESVIKDESNGSIFTLQPGTLIWIPKGATISLISSKDCKTIYFEQREPDEMATAIVKHAEQDTLVPNGTTVDHVKQPTAESVRLYLDSLLSGYIQQNPKSREAFERAQKSIAGGTTRSVLDSTPFPISIKSANGAKLTSVDDVEYIDFVSDFTAGLYGHSNPIIERAVVQAASNGFNIGAVTELEARVAEAIKERYLSIDLLRFCNSGTEANTYAIAGALAYTNRKKVLVFDQAYHGGTLSFGSYQNFLNLPHEFVIGHYDNIEKTQQVLSNDIGVIIVELMQSAGGLRSASTEFVRFLRSAADKIGAVLIFDEVVTSRLGYRGLQGFHGVSPDLTTLGKFHGGGLPFGAFGGKRSIMQQFDPLSTSAKKLAHSGTFNNNIFTMTAAVAASSLFTKAEVDRINELGDMLRDGIRNAAAEAGLADIVATLGFGSCIGVRFLGPWADQLRDAFYFHHLARGVWFGRRGFACLSFANEQLDVDTFLRSTKLFFARIIQ